MKLVLIPGLDGTGDLFAPFAEAMNAVDPGLAIQIIAYPPDRPMTYAEHEAWVRDRLPRQQEFVLLAESFSGPVGISIAASAPVNLKGLILCGSFVGNPLPAFGPLARLISMMPAVKIPPALFAPFLYAGSATPELRKAHASAMSRVSAQTLRARVAEILAVDYASRLRRVEVPMTYLMAKRDRLVPRAAYAKIKRLRPDVELVEFDAPHFMLQTSAYPCAAAVSGFVDFIGTGTRAGIEGPDGPITLSEAHRVSRLTVAEVSAIDSELLKQSSHRWRKVARVVADAMDELGVRIPDLPDAYYAQRVKVLVQSGKLESAGNLDYMRYSEVRLRNDE